MMLTIEEQMVPVDLAQRMEAAGMPPGVFRWFSPDGAGDKWLLELADESIPVLSVPTWTVHEMRDWLRRQGVVGDGVARNVFESKFAVVTTWLAKWHKWYAVGCTVGDTDVDAHALTCLSLLAAIKGEG